MPRFFANIAVTFAARLVQEEAIKTGFSHKSVRRQEVFASKKTCNTPFPIGRKRHHTNQSQNYMANHVIWLLRNRGSCGREGSERVTAIEIACFKS